MDSTITYGQLRVRGVAEKVERKMYDLESLEPKDFLDWYQFDKNTRIKHASRKAYMHLIRSELCDLLYTADYLEPELERLARDYVREKNASKIHSFWFNIKEFGKSLVGIETKYEILEENLKTAKKVEDFSNGHPLNEKVVVQRIPYKKNHFKDLSEGMKGYIRTQRLNGEESPEDLVNKLSLNNKNVVYQVMTEYNKNVKNDYLKQIRNVLNKNDYDANKFLGVINKLNVKEARELSDRLNKHDYDANILPDVINKAKKKTYLKVGTEEKININHLSKQQKVKAEDLAKRFNLSGKHVVYKCNGWVGGQRKQKKKEEEIRKRQEMNVTELLLPISKEPESKYDHLIEPNHPTASNMLN